jgi:dihydroorotate dehydrogenase
MDINTLVLIVILAVIIYAMINNNQKKRENAETNNQRMVAEKEQMSNEEIATYGQVQERKGQLLDLIEANLSDHPEESTQLKEIIDDWANLKIEAFENRRSWVRNPHEKDTSS